MLRPRLSAAGILPSLSTPTPSHRSVPTSVAATTTPTLSIPISTPASSSRSSTSSRRPLSSTFRSSSITSLLSTNTPSRAVFTSFSYVSRNSSYYPPTSTTTNSPIQNNNDSGFHLSVTVGIAVATIVTVGIISLIVGYFIRRKNASKRTLRRYASGFGKSLENEVEDVSARAVAPAGVVTAARRYSHRRLSPPPIHGADKQFQSFGQYYSESQFQQLPRTSPPRAAHRSPTFGSPTFGYRPYASQNMLSMYGSPQMQHQQLYQPHYGQQQSGYDAPNPYYNQPYGSRVVSGVNAYPQPVIPPEAYPIKRSQGGYLMGGAIVGHMDLGYDLHVAYNNYSNGGPPLSPTRRQYLRRDSYYDHRPFSRADDVTASMAIAHPSEPGEYYGFNSTHQPTPNKLVTATEHIQGEILMQKPEEEQPRPIPEGYASPRQDQISISSTKTQVPLYTEASALMTNISIEAVTCSTSMPTTMVSSPEGSHTLVCHESDVDSNDVVASSAKANTNLDLTAEVVTKKQGQNQKQNQEQEFGEDGDRFDVSGPPAGAPSLLPSLPMMPESDGRISGLDFVKKDLR